MTLSLLPGKQAASQISPVIVGSKPVPSFRGKAILLSVVIPLGLLRDEAARNDVVNYEGPASIVLLSFRPNERRHGRDECVEESYMGCGTNYHLRSLAEDSSS